MSLSNTEKAEIVKKYGRDGNDTGSVEVQVALLTADINKLTGHFKEHVKDMHSRTGLIRKVNLRRTLLAYLKGKDLDRYKKIVADLSLRG
jgi:small subunit ribosomal protein S15